MELLYILYILLPGLLIYGKMRKEGVAEGREEPEYVVLIRGFYASIPMIIAGLFFARLVMPAMSIHDTVHSLFTNPIYLLIYFVSIPLYTWVVCLAVRHWNHRIQPVTSKKISKRLGKHYYSVNYDDIMTEISTLAQNHKRLIGRVTKDGKDICLGSVCFLSVSSKKQIGFSYQKEYRAYFENGEARSILNPIGSYLDMENDYVIDLYDGDRIKD